MRRLYLHIYLAFVCILILFGLLAFITWEVLLPDNPQTYKMLNGVGVILAKVLPQADQPKIDQQAALTRLGHLFPAVSLTLFDSARQSIAVVGDPQPPPPSDLATSRRIHAQKGRPRIALALPDGRWLIVEWRANRRAGHLLITLGLLAVAIAIGAYPVARRITRRLERLQQRVDALGAGDLTTRVEVEGRDEVATLARRFNHAADRIERLVTTQRSILAGASHELRSPLARIRVAIELLPTEERPELKTRLTRDIAELDELISELLLASRLDALDRPEHTEDVDLLALLAEESLRTEADVSGEPVTIHGDPRMLRRLIRNLLENARRYAAGSPVEASITLLSESGARLSIADRGPGVPEAERERIFEPFYRPADRRRDRSDSGVGLGLALVRQIAQHHGGEVRCLPRDGGGTCFEVDLHHVKA